MFEWGEACVLTSSCDRSRTWKPMRILRGAGPVGEGGLIWYIYIYIYIYIFIYVYIYICVCLLFPFLKCRSNLEFMAYLPSAASRSEVLRKPSWDHPGKTALVWKGSWSSVMTSKMPCRLGYLLMLHFPVLCIFWNQHWYRWLYIYISDWCFGTFFIFINIRG